MTTSFRPPDWPTSSWKSGNDRLTANGELEPVTEPGQAVLTILRNRRGPRYGFPVGIFTHWAAYFDADS